MDRLLIAGRASFLLGKLFWPTHLVFIYPRWHIDTVPYRVTQIFGVSPCSISLTLALIILGINLPCHLPPCGDMCFRQVNVYHLLGNIVKIFF